MNNMNTFCPQCGPLCKVDEDGCCVTCGSTATGPEVENMMCEIDQMQSQIAFLTAEVQRWKALAMICHCEKCEIERTRDSLHNK